MQLIRLRIICNTTLFQVVLLLMTGIVSAQVDSVALKQNHQGKAVIIATGTAYAATAAFLYTSWYSDYPQSNFHFFNDRGEWLYMDKVGHMASTYYLSRWNTTVFRSAGVEKDKAALTGTITAYAFLMGIEVMDGFSTEWGFSVPDVVANTLGASAFLLQEKFWQEQRITFKFSVQLTDYAQYRPDLLGSTTAERILKDYNGQTYWLSVNPGSFSGKDNWMPSWLNFAVGYGAEGMLGAKSNPEVYNDEALPKYDRYPQFYLAPDIDLTRIKTNSRVIRTLTEVFGFLKIPAPTLEINGKGKLKFHPLYF